MLRPENVEICFLILLLDQFRSMDIIENKAAIRKFVKPWKDQGFSVGLVPTMGALHTGHMQLVRESLRVNDKTVCSIFVNPLQFNNQVDLDKYPNTIDQDLQLLEDEGCDLVFTPKAEAFYEGVIPVSYDFGVLGEVMEAENRPGHFEGVAAVIKELFHSINPSRAYFGEKDYQQLAIIRWLVDKQNLSIEVIPCRTIRSKSGLALSSRNLRLSEVGLTKAAEIYKMLNFTRSNKSNYTPQELKEKALTELARNFEVEYFEIIDEETFGRVEEWNETKCPRAFVAARIEDVRLIDNLSLNP